MSSPSYHMNIAKTILQQLGGQRFITMTGARNFVAFPAPGLQFDLPCNSMVKNHIKRVHVILDPSDTYTVLTMSKKRGQLEYVEVERVSGVYCDMLERIFTDMTGLYTSL